MVELAEGRLFVNGMLSTNDGGRQMQVIDDVMALSQDKKQFIELGQGTNVISGRWMLEIIDMKSGPVTFYREVTIDGETYYIPDMSLRFED